VFRLDRRRVLRLRVHNFDEVDAFVRESSRIGFAFPVDGDQFSVIRFDVKGAAQALSAMRTIVEKRSKRPIRNPTQKILCYKRKANRAGFEGFSPMPADLSMTTGSGFREAPSFARAGLRAGEPLPA
jgi:hypothetical protein